MLPSAPSSHFQLCILLMRQDRVVFSCRASENLHPFPDAKANQPRPIPYKNRPIKCCYFIISTLLSDKSMEGRANGRNDKRSKFSSLISSIRGTSRILVLVFQIDCYLQRVKLRITTRIIITQRRSSTNKQHFANGAI